jgi:hypothetical protein
MERTARLARHKVPSGPPHPLVDLSLILLCTITLTSGKGSLLTVGFYEAFVEPSSVKVARNVSRACSWGQEYYFRDLLHFFVEMR